MYPEGSDERRVYMLGLPPSKSINSLFNVDDIKKLHNKREIDVSKCCDIVAGVVIGDALTPTVIAYRWGNVLLKEDVFLSSSMREIVTWIKLKLKENNVIATIFSFSGLNLYIKEELCEIENICFLSDFEFENEFKNARAFVYQQMQKWIYKDNGNLISINDEDVIDNLCSIEAKFNGLDKLAVESQSSFKDRYNTSCNYSDAFANTFILNCEEKYISTSIFDSRKSAIIRYPQYNC
jgi:hypothetical protein